MKAVSALCLPLFLITLGAAPAAATPTLVYSTWLGGEGVDLAVDSAGNAIVLGYGSDYFLARLSPRGELIFLRPVELPSEPSMNERVLSAVALDPAGNIYIAGTERFNSCYGEDPYQCSANDYHLGLAAKLGPDGTGLLYHSHLYEGDSTRFHDLAVDALGRAHLHVTYRWPDRYGYPYWEGIRLSPAGSREGYFGYPTFPAYGVAFVQVTAIAMGPSGDLFAVGWSWLYPEDPMEDYPVRAYLQRRDASSGAVVEIFLDDRIHPMDVAGAPGGGSVVVGRVGDIVAPGIGDLVDPGVPQEGDLYIAEYGPAGEKVFSRVLNLGAVQSLDVAVTSSGQIVLAGAMWSNGSLRDPFVLRLEGGNGEVISSMPGGWAVAVGPGGDAYVASGGFLSRYTENRPPVCSGAVASPSSIWPPDRRQVRISTLGVTDPDGDPVTLKVTRILQDELFTARMPDAGSLGTAKPWVRADRMDNGDGRVYHLFFEATDPAGAKCTGEVKVCVPLQSGGTCRDGGARIDSTQPR